MTESFLLIDLSYTIFYRFHATLNWYKIANKDEEITEDTNLYENIQFKNMFVKKFYESLEFCIKKNKIPYEHIFVCKDCPREQIWRNQYKEQYKGNRQGIKYNGGEFFKLVYTDILPNLIEEKKINKNILEYATLEADDIIAITKQYIRKHFPESFIYIITSDHDLLQLIDDKTYLYNLKKKCINEKSSGDSSVDLQMKILCGDKSDNIPQCFSKCGEKTALKLIQNPELLKEKLTDPIIYKQYQNNKLLIDFSMIPTDLHNSFTSYLVKCFQT